MSTSNYQIDTIDTTSDLLTGRAGLTTYCRYLESSGILDRLEADFSSIKGSSKGLEVRDFFKQVLNWLMDGTSKHINYFDDLKKRPGLLRCT